MLEVDRLSFSYREDKKIFTDLSLELERREFTGIIGPNGSGKSTLLKNLSRLYEPDGGSIYLDGRSLNRLSAGQLARRLAVVPQEMRINFQFTVYDLVMMGRNPYQNRWGSVSEKDRDEVERAMALTDVRKFRDKTIDELSGGERQRVIIARALAQAPELLLLDEPASNLDINYKSEIFDLLSYLNRESNLTILVVSHDLNLAAQYCRRLVLLDNGEIHSQGSPDKVLTEENIGSVYEAGVVVEKNQITGRPYVTVLPRKHRKYQSLSAAGDRVHVICGGGNAGNLLQRLYFAGFEVSCGVINQGDSDWNTARRFGFDTVDIPPFAYLDEEALEENAGRIERAELVLVGDLPFGHGNVDNLLQLKEFPDKDIIMLNRRDIEVRDYTGGQAAEIWNELTARQNVKTARREEEMLSIVENLLTGGTRKNEAREESG